MRKMRLFAPIAALLMMAACAFMLVGCSNTLSEQPEDGANAAVPDGFGAVRVSVSLDVARTAMPTPTLTDFARLEYWFAKGSAEPVEKTAVDGVFILETGNYSSTYTLTVKAYFADADESPAAQGTSSSFSVSTGQAYDSYTTITVALRPVVSEEGTGSLSFAMSYPATAEVETFTFTPFIEGDPITLTWEEETEDGVTTRTGSKAGIPSGYYFMQIALTKADYTGAGAWEAVHIYQNLTTELGYTFTDAEFIAIVDKTALNDVITAASTDKDGVETSTDSGSMNKAPGTKWVTTDVMSALTAAINAAQTVANKVVVTQNVVDNAVEALNTAIGAFTDAIQTVVVNKTALNDAITAANSAKTGVEISTDSLSKDKAPGTKWVTDTVMTAFTTAIEAAQAVKDNDTATQNEVGTAVTALSTAKTTFTTATRTVVINKTALNDAITAATTAKTGVEISTDSLSKDKAPGTKWVTDTVMTAFTTAIEAAQAVVADTTATQNVVDNAVTALNTAKTTFTTATQTVVVNKIALNDAITAATAAKAYITSSETDPATGSKWVLPEDLATFNAAIEAAQTVKDHDTTTQNEVDTAVSDLNNAKSAFNDNLKDVTNGKVSESGIAITLWQNGTIANSSGSTTISKTGNGSFTATVNSGYANVQWYVNSVLIDGSTMETITIRAVDYIIGTYRLVVTTFKDAVPYAAEISFTVTR
jgi:hypothetical protein